MFNSKLKIASISAEVDPYSKSGGLGDVARSLPKALKRQGHDVVVVTPFYGSIIDPEKYNLKKIKENVTIIIDNKHKEKVNFWQGELMEGLPIYFIENEKYFSNKKELYGSSHENARFLLFDLAALKLLIKIKFKADIIHCHDWHTGLIPYFIKRDFKNSDVLKNTASVFTIHNLTFQLGRNWWEISEKDKDNGKNGLPDFNNPKIENINFVKRAILNADVINAVSEQYAEEILTRDFGQDLNRVLKNRETKVFGIVNGIDYKDYNPSNDPGLVKNFDYYSLNNKEKNKLHLQKMFGLPENKHIPVIGMACRLAEQKGFDLIRDISDVLFRFNLQIIISGSGDKEYTDKIKKLVKQNPEKIAANFEFISSKDTTKLYAGADMYLMPSRFEPCGVTQMIAMRYGTIPIVRHVGGLIDTVVDYDPAYKSGNGFVFKPYDSRAMIVAISRAIECYKREKEWRQLVEKVMRKSYSWEYPARKYIDLFRTAIKFKDNK
ncbi:glycogen synthase [Candidatus Parcubacteria bacterium]|nr:glycogen synthase [Patescibacteria group bacterium]MCG2686613.1 glycogen synthase [Candidatus Parcubacteria bacterium]